jgi:hypothetical protein
MPKIQMRSARTVQSDPAVVAEELVNQLGSFVPKCVMLFASRERDHAALNREIRARLPKDVPLMGASTGGEIDNTGMHTGSALLTALGGDLEVGIGMGDNLGGDGVGAGNRAIEEAASQLGQRVEDLNPSTHVGLVMDDAFKQKKEELLLGVLERNQALVLTGGGASDTERDMSKGSAILHVNDRVSTDAALVALIRTEAPWRVMRSHWYTPTGRTLRITKVDETHTRAIEIDGKPAAERYAESIGATVADLPYGMPNGFSKWPTALKVGREYFIRAPWTPLPDGSVVFANLLEAGSEYEIMKAGDPVAMTRQFFEEEIPRRVPSPQGALLFHCGGRTFIAEGLGKLDELAGTFRTQLPVAGLNVYFEIYCGFSINNTLTSLVFGAS